MKRVFLTLSALVLLLSLSACKKDDGAKPGEPAAATKAEPAKAEPAKAAEPAAEPAKAEPAKAAEPAAEPAKAPEAPKGIELAEMKDEAWGYAIKMPKGAQELMKDEYGQTYSLVLPDGMNEFNVSIGKVEAASMDDAVGFATTMGGTVADKKEVPGGFEVVMAPRGPIQEVFVFKKGPTTPLHVKCTGPTGELAKLVEIAESFTVTK